MTDFNIDDNGYTTDLTVYNNNDTELFIHKDGSVYASQSGMARMLEMQAGHLNFVMKNKAKTNNVYLPVTRAKVVGIAGREIMFFSLDTLVALAAEYSSELAKRFSLAGATMYCYQLAGYKMEVKVKPADPVAPLNILEIAKQAQKLLNEQIEQLIYTENKPGLTAILATAHDKDALLVGLMSFDEMCEYRYIPELQLNLKKVLAKELTAAISNLHREQVKTKNVRHPRGSKKDSYYKVKAFPVDCLAAFDNVIAKYSK